MSDLREHHVKQVLLADYHYLGARLHYMHGLFPVAASTAALAIEQYAKCLLKLEGKDEKITHDIKKGIQELGLNFDQQQFDAIADFQRAYDLRYPENWEKLDVIWTDQLSALDFLVCQLRNKIIQKLKEMKLPDIKNNLLLAVNRSKDLMPGLTVKHGVMTTLDVFARSNDQLGNFTL